MADNSRGTLADRSRSSIGHRSHWSSRDEISSSLSESRLGGLNFHGVGSLGRLNRRSVSRGDGTVGMADYGRGTLADRSRSSIGQGSHWSSRDEISSSLSESRLGGLNFHGVGSLGRLNRRSVSRGDGTVGMADNS